MARYDIPMGKIESKLESFKKWKTKWYRTGRRKNEADDSGDAAAYEERGR